MSEGNGEAEHIYRQIQTSKYRLNNKHKKTKALNPEEDVLWSDFPLKFL